MPRGFYARPTQQVARELLGMELVHVVDGIARRGRIVETEAYIGPQDLASHSSKGITPRTRTMYGPPGHAYVYLIYGMYHCMNAVTEPEGHGSAVLIRALEPLYGIEGDTRGPGLLCQAMGIDRSLNGADLVNGNLHIARGTPQMQNFTIAAGPRIGVAYAGSWAAQPLRFTVAGSPWLSRKA